MNGPAAVATLPAAYPGLVPAPDADGGAIGPFAAADDAALWVLDFHAPRGLTPLGLTAVGYTARASRDAADAVPMPGARGLAARVAGCHPYFAPLGVAEAAAADRAARGAERLPGIIERAGEEWPRRAAELDRDFAAAMAGVRAARGRTGARRALTQALDVLASAWRVHFDFMYPLLAGYFMFVDYAGELGIPADRLPALLQGYETTITRTDRAIWALAAEAHALGVAGALRDRDEPARWLRQDAPEPFRARVRELVARFGWRTEGIYEVALVPWADDPTPVLERVRSLLDEVETRSYADVHAASVAVREQAERDVLAGLTVAEAAQFRAALAAARAANFAWWNEDHNAYVDLRAHIPLRCAALAVADAVGLSERERVVYLFRDELLDLADGRLDVREAERRIPERVAFHAASVAERGSVPMLAGTAPQRVHDPVLREIFGVTADLVRIGDDAPPATELRGIPASPGVAQGRARVLRSSRALHELADGEVLVCEATTPSWTSAFASAGACVCDQGGRLTHAAIVSREYGVPCVTGTARATRVIATGDLVEVDGRLGRVRILRRAADR
jgi:pyruvate,water dikinase